MKKYLLIIEIGRAFQTLNQLGLILNSKYPNFNPNQTLNQQTKNVNNFLKKPNI